MRIAEIDLTDWCQHRKLKRGFGDSNLIGLIGSNGSGKSNILQAIEFAAIGETTDKLEEYVRDGAEVAKVRLVMKIRKATATVRRTIKKDGKATAHLEVIDEDGTETFNSVRAVNDELETLLGIDKDLAKNNVFVRQKHLDDILFTTPAKRERAWQRMCGMADAEKIHKTIGEVISSLPDEQDYTAQIYECGENIEELSRMVEVAESELEKLREQDQFDLSKILEAMSDLEKCERARQNLPQYKVRLAEAEGNLNGAKDELSAVKDELENLKEDEHVLQQKEDAVNGLLAKLESTKSTKRLMEGAEKDLLLAQENLAGLPSYDVSECETALEQLEKSIQVAEGKVATVRAQRDMHEALADAIKQAGDLAWCPLCGSAIDGDADLLCRISAKVDELAASEAKVRDERNEDSLKLNNGRVELNRHVSQTESLTNRVRMLEENLEKYKAEIDSAEVQDYDEGHLREVVMTINSEKTRIIALRRGLPTMEQAVANAAKQLATAESDYLLTETDSSAKPADMDIPAQIAQLKVVHADALRIREEISGKESDAKARKESIETWKKTKSDLESKAGKGTAHTKVKSSLDRVRKWFHYSQGPHKLSMAVLNELTAGVNEFLGTLDGRFYVEPDPENLMFNLVFVDGRPQPEVPRPATRGSGGEKSSLATSFRLASYYMFAGQLGLLCLDEPTEYLDARKIESFGRVIEQLKEIGNQLDLQIFMATHRTSFINLFDEVIHCGESAPV